MTTDEEELKKLGLGRRHGHNPATVVVPATAAQARFFTETGQMIRDIQDEARPGRTGSVLKALIATRDASLDLRLAGREMDGPGKLAAAADRIAAIRQQRGGLQIVLCDRDIGDGRPGRWSIRGELAAQLGSRGIHPDAIRYPREHLAEEAMGRLARDCVDGKVSVLIGSTIDMSRVNLRPQSNYTAAHHLDPPYQHEDAGRRAALEPREEFIYITPGGGDVAWWREVTPALRTIGLDPAEAALNELVPARNAQAVRRIACSAARKTRNPERGARPGR